MSRYEPQDQSGEPGEIETLLPFYANGTLNPADRQRVAEALATSPALARQLELIAEERHLTIALHDALPAGPRPAALDRLMASVAAEPRKPPMLERAQSGLIAWLGTMLGAMSPRRLAYAAVAAAVLLVVQGVALTGLLMRGGSETTFEMASAPAGYQTPGTFVLVTFADSARAQDVTSLLERQKASIVDGPRPNGAFKIRVGERGLSRAELDAIMSRFMAERAVISFVAPVD
jgi:anti-sigma factor RsiW